MRSGPVARSSYRGQAPKATRAQAGRIQRQPLRRAYAPPRPVAQQQPSTERYREIQQALIDKGYLRAEANGNWNADSVAALNRFKQDQNQRADGRLDSRALITLGLGPKKDSYISVPAPVAAEQAIGSQERQ